MLRFFLFMYLYGDYYSFLFAANELVRCSNFSDAVLNFLEDPVKISIIISNEIQQLRKSSMIETI